MKRWLIGGLAIAVIYVLGATSVYEREAARINEREISAGYRLEDAEETRRQVAQQIQVAGKADGSYQQDPAYLAAQAKVETAVNDFPSRAPLGIIRADAVRYGIWGAGVYAIILVAVMLRRTIGRQKGVD